MKLNLGMDNCFEAARLLGATTMYASSLAVNGKRANYGNRPSRRRPGERRIPIRQAQDHERVAGAGLHRNLAC
jgi:hypothetical protein